MKNIFKILLEAVASFLIGAAILFVILVCYGVRYMMKMHTGAFAFVINGKGADIGNWQVLSSSEIIFICGMGGLILLLIDLVWNIIKAIQSK